MTLERARRLVLEHGWNATAYQIINPGIRHWFAAEDDAVAGYVEHGGVRVVAGAPVCAEERLGSVVTAFERDARAAGCSVCYFGAEARLEAACSPPRSGRHARVLLGAQPTWDPRAWADIPAGHASVRAQLNRARNKGVRVSEWPASEAEQNPELRRCLREWLATRGLPPLHFLVEPDTLTRLSDRHVFVAEQRGVVLAFLIASPIPARSGWLVEQLVRGWNAPNGTTDLLVDAAMRSAAGIGAKYVTLGLAPLSRRSGIAASSSEPLWLRGVLHWVRAHGRRFYDFDGLDAFKARFRPAAWEPVYAIASERPFTPRMLYAIAAAFSGGSPFAMVARGLGRAAWWEVRGTARRRNAGR